MSGAIALGERKAPHLDATLLEKLDTISAQISSLEERLSYLEASSRGSQHDEHSHKTLSNWNGTTSQATSASGVKWYCANNMEELRNACRRESGVECTQETRATDCQSDEGCMGIDCLWVPEKCSVQRKKNDGANQLQRPTCNRAQVRHGSWTAVTLPHAPYIPIDPWQKTCATRDGLDFSASWSSHRWTPDDSSCDFAEWDACTFCDVLATGIDGIGGAYERPVTEGDDRANSGERDVITISFVGDSTTFQHFSSLALLLDLSVTERDQHTSRKTGTSIAKMACEGRVRMSYLRDDTLDKVHTELETQKSDIIVFNTGVHYRNDRALMGSINNTISTLEKWQGICRQKKGSRWCLPILRTTVPGHPHCSNYTAPFNDLPTMEHRIQSANYTAFGGDHYFWWKMNGQNRLVENAFSQRRSTLDYEVLDAYDVMVRRPDGHTSTTDCVHYCLPGPPDVLSRMLLHTLVRRYSGQGS